MAALETIIWGPWVQYSDQGGASYGGGGVYAGSAMETFDNNTGKKCSMGHISGRWGTPPTMWPFSNVQTACDQLHAVDKLPYIEWFSWDFTNHNADFALRADNIIAGHFNAYITAFWTAIKTWGKRIIVRFNHEANERSGGFPWSFHQTDNNEVFFGGYAISSITASGTTYTVTTATTAGITSPLDGSQLCTWQTGQRVKISGASVATYNNTWTITRVSDTQFRMTGTVSNPGTAGAAGTAQHGWTNTNAKYKQSFDTVGAIKDQVGADNAMLFWCPNVASNGGLTFAQQAPNLQYIDIFGLDGYPYRPDMTLWESMNGGVASWGSNTGLQDSYNQLCALHPTMPFMIGETQIHGCWDTTTTNPAISGITTNGTEWVVTTAALPVAHPWEIGQGVEITGASNAAYNSFGNQAWTISRVINATTQFAIANTSQPGASTFTNAKAQLIDRKARAIALRTSLTDDLPNKMPRCKYFSPFWVCYNGNKHTLDWIGNMPNTLDMIAWREGIGNAHYLAGGFMSSAASGALLPLPYNDVILPAGYERVKGVWRSQSNAECFILFSEASGTATLTDQTGKGRNAVANGAAATTQLAQITGGVPSESTWGNLKFNGVAADYYSIPHAAAFSPGQTPRWGFTIPVYIPVDNTVPIYTYVGKGTGGAYEWILWSGTNQIGFTLNNATGGNVCFWSRITTDLSVGWHLVTISVDLAVANQANCIMPYIDGVARGSTVAPTGSMLNPGTAPVTFGRMGDGSRVAPATVAVGPAIFYSTNLSAETAADEYAVWKQGPQITNLAVAVS
jgi:hypothetical protein